MTSQTIGIEDFQTAVWHDGEVLVDEGETFKKALGGEEYKNRWLLSPAVIRRIIQATGFGSQMDDLNDKSKMLGGAMLVSKKGVLFAEAETSSFAYPSAKKLLDALDAGVSCTPSTADATGAA